MTQEQEKALKVVENLISNIGCHRCHRCHSVSTEDIMILIQGIMSNECNGCNWKYVHVPQYQPGLERDIDLEMYGVEIIYNEAYTQLKVQLRWRNCSSLIISKVKMR